MTPKKLKPEDFCIGSMYDRSDKKERRCIIGHCQHNGVPTIFRQMLTYTCAMCLTDPLMWHRLSPERALQRAREARTAIADELGVSDDGLPAFSAQSWPNLAWVKVQCNDLQGPQVAARAWNMAVAMFLRSPETLGLRLRDC